MFSFADQAILVGVDLLLPGHADQGHGVAGLSLVSEHGLQPRHHEVRGPFTPGGLVAGLLRDFVAVVKSDGVELDRGKGSDVLGHPLNAVVWLAKDMARNGQAMKRGDLIGLGWFSKLRPPKAGLAVEVVYQGLPGDPAVTVSFKQLRQAVASSS